MQTRTLKIVYWVVTPLFLLLQGWAAVQYLMDAPAMVRTITELGYPVHFMKILGVAKLLGIAAILYGRWPTLKEWAYAGFTFDVIAASLTHLIVGDPPYIALVPLLFLIAQLTSYFIWKKLSREGVTPQRDETPHSRPFDAGPRPYTA